MFKRRKSGLAGDEAGIDESRAPSFGVFREYFEAGGPLQVINALNLIICTGCPKPQPLQVTMNQNVFASDQLCATIEDCVPMVNIMPFGPCAFTPLPPSPSGGPCVPKPTGTWQPGSPTTTYDHIPALRVTDTLQCGQGGTIAVMEPGQPELTVD